MIHTLQRDKVVFKMSKDVEPILRVKSGDSIAIETEDCFCHSVTCNEDELSCVDFKRVNPATGPIYIEDAEPGDTLNIEIENILLDAQGVTSVLPDFGVLGKSIKEFTPKMIRLKDGYAYFNNFKIPVKPMIGVIGVAPENGEIFCGEPGAHGGNLDTLQITNGSIVKLPVFHPGALLSIGDVHASMGEGEVCGTGIETRASVSIRVEVEKKKINFPIIESRNDYFVLSSDTDIEQAVINAVKNAVEFIMEKKNLSFTDAYMLTSIACDLMVSQVVNPKKTAKVKIPKYLLNSN